MVSIAATVLTLFGLVVTTGASMSCRVGTATNDVDDFWLTRCPDSKRACFQSVKCIMVGWNYSKQYQWACIDNCSPKSFTAYHQGVNGKSEIMHGLYSVACAL